MLLYVVAPVLLMCAVFEWIFPAEKKDGGE